MYKRGVGEVKVVHRTYEASEKELSCRCARRHCFNESIPYHEYTVLEKCSMLHSHL